MSAAVAITRLDRSAEELRQVAARVRDAKAARRLLAIALVLDGAPRSTAAQQCGMDRQTLRDWVHRDNEGGVEALRNHISPGRPRRLTQAQEQAFESLVEQGPDLERDGVARWRCADLQRQIAQHFSVRYHERSVGKLLARAGMRRLSVRPVHPQKEAAAQAAYKKTSQR